MRRTPWERGRLRQHEFTSARMALAMRAMTTSFNEAAQADIHNQLEEDDDDIDVLDDEEYDCQHSLDTSLIPLATILANHQRALGCGEIELRGPRMMGVDEIGAGQFYELINFTQEHFYTIVSLHSKLPDEMHSTISRHHCSKEMGLFLMLLRWRNHTFAQIEAIVNIRRNICSDLYNTVIDILKDTDYVILACNVDIARVQSSITHYQEGTESAGTTSAHKGMVCATDGKPMRSCRPSNIAAKKTGFNSKDDVQNLFYSGYIHCHGLRISHTIWADGIAQCAVGSIKDADQKLLSRSELPDTLRYIGEKRARVGEEEPLVYGDPAYTSSKYVHRKHKGAISKEQERDNACMIKPRSPAEDTFKDLIVLFPFFDDKLKHKILTHGRAKYKDELILCTLFYNLHTCCYSNQASSNYYVPPPTMEEYYERVNMVPCGVIAMAHETK